MAEKFQFQFSRVIEVELPLSTDDWPKCYYVPEQLCGEKTICDCPSCPIRCGARQRIYELKKLNASPHA